MNITVFHANECDKKKCTAIKLAKMGKCRLVENINKIPSGAIVLNPYAEKAVSYEDYRYVQRRGIVGPDCSWNEVSSSKILLPVQISQIPSVSDSDKSCELWKAMYIVHS